MVIKSALSYAAAKICEKGSTTFLIDQERYEPMTVFLIWTYTPKLILVTDNPRILVKKKFYYV